MAKAKIKTPKQQVVFIDFAAIFKSPEGVSAVKDALTAVFTEKFDKLNSRLDDVESIKDEMEDMVDDALRRHEEDKIREIVREILEDARITL